MVKFTQGRTSGCTVTKLVKSVDSTLYGHWHQPYKPPWWRVIKRWKGRRRTIVPGTFKRYE